MIHVPEPLPDELTIGHLGRIYILNGVAIDSRNSAHINKYAGLDSKCARVTPYTETLAALVGQTFPHYLFHHSLLPFYRAVQAGRTKRWSTTDQNAFQVRKSACRVNTFGTRLCPCCIEEDMAFWGFSYWRRSHQLPGINWCNKHGQALLKTRSDAPLKRLPQHAQANAERFDPAISIHAMQNTVIHRYSEICLEFLGRDHPLSTNQMVSCLQQRARKLQVRSNAGVTGFHLHDMAMQQANGEWLSEHFSDILARGSSSSLTRTYTSKTIAYTTMYYALALALLYESSDEAFTDLDAAADLDNTFWAASSPQDQNADAATKLQHAMEGFLQGMPVEQACRETGVERRAFEKLLRAAARRSLNVYSQIGLN